MVSFIKKKTDKHLFCKSYWAHAVSSDLQEKSCKAELNNLLWNAEVRQSIWGNTPPRNEKQHNSGSLQRPNAHEGSIRCTATCKSKDYSYESATMIGLQNFIPYSMSSARSYFSSDVVLTWCRETIIYESLNLLTSWYKWVSSLKILMAMFITSLYFEATLFLSNWQVNGFSIDHKILRITECLHDWLRTKQQSILMLKIRMKAVEMFTGGCQWVWTVASGGRGWGMPCNLEGCNY